METFLRDSKRSILALFLFLGATLFANQSFGQASQTFSTPGTFTYTVPAGVTRLTVLAWGGGGAGGGVVGQQKGGGGGAGGAFVRGTVTVTPGTQYSIVVGTGGVGSSANGTNGGPSSFGALFIAVGGGGGAVGNTLGAGGNAGSTGNLTSGTSIISNYGGNGGTASTNNTASSGGGGGSAGAGGAGGNGASAPQGQPNGGAGAAGAAGSPSSPGFAGGLGRGSSSDGNGNPGTGVGAGGGGGRNANNTTTYTGGTGGAGQVIVWTCPAATISYSLPSFCNSVTSASVAIIGTSGGSFSSTAGLTLNTSTGQITPSTSTAGTYTVQYQLGATGGCPAFSTSTTVAIGATPVSSVVGQSDINCFAGSDGTITISASGGTGPYSYSVDNGLNWVPSATNPFVYPGLSAGVAYQIRVKDNNDCKSQSVH